MAGAGRSPGGGVNLLDGELLGLAEDLERGPARHLGHAGHAGGHGAGGIDDPGIVGLLEPERHHVVLPVAGPVDDRPEHLVLAESEISGLLVMIHFLGYSFIFLE